MKRTIILILGTTVLLAGCGRVGDSPPMQPPAAAVQFTALVRQVLAVSTETATPIELANLDIVFDDDNPQAFDDILAAAP